MKKDAFSRCPGPTRVSLTKTRGPFGVIWMASTEKGLCGIHLGEDVEMLKKKLSSRKECVFREAPQGNTDAVHQLSQYFQGKRRSFETELDLWGTQFEISVWRSLIEIPYGKTKSYGEVAASLGMPKAARAVGGAASRNLVPIVVPCHRLVRRDGGLGGFSSGIAMKKSLLELERRFGEA
jgi:O-6-methylguanine DNA methyltransferase